MGVGVVMWVVVVMVGGTLATQPLSSANEAKDCVIYESTESSNLHRTFERRVSLGIIPQQYHFSADLRLLSANANISCSLKLLSEIIAGSCEGGDGRGSWTFSLPKGIFLAKDTTELWLQVGEDDGDGGGGGSSEGYSSSSSSSNSDLLLVGRRGGHRRHLLIPSTGLLPPFTIQLQNLLQMNYYFNCVTGCLYGRMIRTQPGHHTIYLHPESTFLYLNLNYDSDYGPRSLNLTSDDLGRAVGGSGAGAESGAGARSGAGAESGAGSGSGPVINVTVVWDSQAGNIGALVDGNPMEGLGNFNPLEKQVIQAQVFGDGLLTECLRVFRRVAGGGGGVGRGATDEGGDDEDDGEATKGDGEAGNNNNNNNNKNSTSSSTSTPPCDSNLGIVLGILLTVIVVLFATTVFFAVLNHRARGNHDFPRVPSFRGSKHKREASVKASKTEEDYQGSSSDVTSALSETMTTDIPSPGSLSIPRPSKIVASKEFISLEI